MITRKLYMRQAKNVRTQLTACGVASAHSRTSTVQNRAACREKIRRHTIRHAHHILEQGVEEQKVGRFELALLMLANGTCTSVDHGCD
jgi:site-specific recombinase XerD